MLAIRDWMIIDLALSIGLLNMEKYDSPITLWDIFEVGLHNINKHECKWDQLSGDEEGRICGKIAYELEVLLHKTQKDTAWVHAASR